MGQARTLTLQAVDARRFMGGASSRMATSQPRSGVSRILAKIMDSKIIYLGYTLLADRGALVAVVSEKHSEPPVV